MDDGWTDGRMMDGWLDEWVDGRMDACTDGWTSGWMAGKGGRAERGAEGWKAKAFYWPGLRAGC